MAEVNERRYRSMRVALIALAIAVVGFVGCAIGLLVDPDATFFGYLTALAYVTSIALGGLIFLMICYATNAKWAIVVRRLNEAIAGVFPILALLFIPLVFGLDRLYLWIDPPSDLPEHILHKLEHKEAYLNRWGFVLRTVVYFAVWIVAAGLLRRWSLRVDRDAGESSPGHDRERVFSSAMLPAVALALTFASFDWLMSLQPVWFSSIFPIYYFAGGFIASLGLLTLLGFAAVRSDHLRGLVMPPHFHALGRMMLGFVIFWTYIAFFQAMLIQIANRPEEVEFYLHRLDRGWDVVAWILLFGHFVVPFAILLIQSIKFSGRIMASVGAWLLVMHYLDVYWLVAPVLESHGGMINLWDLSALAAVGGSSVAYAAFRLRGRSMAPIRDPWLAKSAAYRSPN